MQKTIVFILFLFGLCLDAPAWASEPTLTLVADSEKISFSRADLLKSKALEKITVETDPAYPGQHRSYQAIPMAHLFKSLHLQPDAVIQFKSLDGFSAVISKERLLSEDSKGSRAYLAIETPEEPWPPVKAGKPSAGPFYLIWSRPELSKITLDEWPYQLASFEVKGSLATLYPHILPDEKLKEKDPIRHGFEVFVRNCFACHTLNREGAAQVGPDLNVPMSPTEYLQEKAFRRLVRNPQNLRYWPQSRMIAFTPEMLPEKDLSDLILYLRHMTGRRVLVR